MQQNSVLHMFGVPEEWEEEIMSKFTVDLVVGAALIGVHPYTFRCGQKGIITGVKYITPNEGDEPRLCYEVTYPDGAIDYVAFTMVENGDCKIGRT